MNQKDFNEVLFETINNCVSILNSKAKEYATVDRLHNFKIAAGLQECTTLQALGGMMAKHTVSVYDMIKTGNKYPMALWNEKIIDSINYLLLLKALVSEGNENEQAV